MPRKKLDSVLSPMKIRRRNSGLGRMSFYYHVFLESIFYSSYVMNVVSNIFLLDISSFFCQFQPADAGKKQSVSCSLVTRKVWCYFGIVLIQRFIFGLLQKLFFFFKLLTQLLNSFYLMFHIHIDGFLTFSGGMEMEHWAKKA